MKKTDYLIVFFTIWCTIATIKWYKNSRDADMYKDKYYNQVSSAVEYGLEAVDNMKGWSSCLSEKATETAIRTKCERDLYDLREWLRDKYNKKEI